jgi:hypothetical protein
MWLTTVDKAPLGLEITARKQESILVFEFQGISDFVAEIGEQLAWLGSTLRSSPNNLEVTYCTARAETAQCAISNTNQGDLIQYLQCKIGFEFSSYEGPLECGNG